MNFANCSYLITVQGRSFRIKVASEGNALHGGKPQMRRAFRSLIRRSSSPPPSSSPPAPPLATKAFASHARSNGGWPTPHHDSRVNSSIRTHWRMSITRSSFGVSAPRAPQVPGSACAAPHARDPSSGKLCYRLSRPRDQGFDGPIMPEMAASHAPCQLLGRKNPAGSRVLQEARLLTILPCSAMTNESMSFEYGGAGNGMVTASLDC